MCRCKVETLHADEDGMGKKAKTKAGPCPTGAPQPCFSASGKDSAEKVLKGELSMNSPPFMHEHFLVNLFTGGTKTVCCLLVVSRTI